MLAGNSTARNSVSEAGTPTNKRKYKTGYSTTNASETAGITNITRASCPTQKKTKISF